MNSTNDLRNDPPSRGVNKGVIYGVIATLGMHALRLSISQLLCPCGHEPHVLCGAQGRVASWIYINAEGFKKFTRPNGIRVKCVRWGARTIWKNSLTTQNEVQFFSGRLDR